MVPKMYNIVAKSGAWFQKSAECCPKCAAWCNLLKITVKNMDTIKVKITLKITVKTMFKITLKITVKVT